MTFPSLWFLCAVPMAEEVDRWPALESSPESFTSFMHALGLPAGLSFVDVYSLDDEEALAWVPSPVHAVIFAYEVCNCGHRC